MGAVLERILFFIDDKSGVEITRLPSKRTDKIAVYSSADSEAGEIMHDIIEGSSSFLKKEMPVEGKIIKPLYLFLDDEILLYAKLKKIRFKEERKKNNKIEGFLDSLEKKHPEVKRAVVNSLLELYGKG